LPPAAAPRVTFSVAFDIENPIGTGTDEELLEFTRAAIAQITLHGVAYTVRGRQLTRASLQQLREQVQWLEARISAAEGGGSKTNSASRQRPL
jgi:hypothetical protein